MIKGFLMEYCWVPYAARHLRRFIKKQRPDLLWIIGYGWSIPVLHRVVGRLGIPYHMSVHDMADTDGQVFSLGKKRAEKFQRFMEELYAGASGRDVYSEEIGSEMERVTAKKQDLIIHCGAEPEEMAKIPDKLRETPFVGKIRMGYPGTIISEETFARFIEALKLLPNRWLGRVEVNLFGTHSYRSRPWFDASLIVEHGYLPEDELDRLYRECDWGLAIMALDGSNQRYNEFSFPCKFARALASGLPVLCIASKETTLGRFAGRYPFTPVISERDPLKIAELLGKVLDGFPGQTGFRNQIAELVESEFNAAKNRKSLHRLFQDLGNSETE
jgi:glycosyltransferase involved in cell wall biosynthesis